MSNYKGRRKGTRRIVIWAANKAHEWIIEGTKADGDAFEARKRVELAAGRRLSTRTAPTFSEFCLVEYGPHAETHLKRSTWNDVRKYQVATLNEFFGSSKLSEIALQDVESYKRIRAAQVEASSVNNELRVFRTILNWAESLGYPVASLAFKKLPVRGEGRVKVWTVAELERLWEACRKEAPALLPVLVFLVNTGCRKGEAIAAEWEWMDFAAGMVRIPSNPFWQPKSGRPREVPMADAVRAILTGEPKHKRWVFPNQLKARYLRFPKELFWRARDAAGLEGGVHTLRHTFASFFLHQVPDMFLLGQVMGHSTARVTALYTHLLPDHLSRARNAVNIAPTMAATMAEPSGIDKRPKKTHQRH